MERGTKKKIIKSVKTSIAKEWNRIAIFTIVCLVFASFASTEITRKLDNLDNEVDGGFQRCDYLFLRADLLDNKFETLRTQLNIQYIQIKSTNDSLELSRINTLIDRTCEEMDNVMLEMDYIDENLTIELNTIGEKIDMKEKTGNVQFINHLIQPLFQILLPITTLFLGFINASNKLVLFGKIGILKLYAMSLILYALTFILFIYTSYVVFNDSYMLFGLIVLFFSAFLIFKSLRRTKTIKEDDGLYVNFNELLTNIDYDIKEQQIQNETNGTDPTKVTQDDRTGEQN